MNATAPLGSSAADPAHADPHDRAWFAQAPPWGRSDLLALGLWTLALCVFFGDLLSFRQALFYFDITEINLPYRDFFARELKAGRFSRWIPGLYCGHPLFSESQAGYLHPLKYLLYPWLETWKAFSLDVVLSIWLTGVGGYVWLRRHVGPWAALTGAAIVGSSGFTWAHFVHTSMINALASVPWLVWGLEDVWATRRRRGTVVGGVALACQVFAGHLQDAILTGGLLGAYAAARALTERGLRRRLEVLAPVLGIGLLGVLLSAVQWIPSKELIDRSPRAGGLTWDELTYGSWHPELLPSLLVREAYGTRARDTDWMDGFYPYHEMNTYVGIVGLLLALVGAAAYRDRWVAWWIVAAAAGGLLMLGRFTFLMDLMPRVPIVGSGRIPVRYHLWLVLATAALAAVGVDRLGRRGLAPVRWKRALAVLAALAAISLPILIYVYLPAWTERARWPLRSQHLRSAWLAGEWVEALVRTAGLLIGAILTIRALTRPGAAANRARLLAILPLLCLADLLLAHRVDVPRIDPRYWTEPPRSARWLAEQPDAIRVYGEQLRTSGEPGYASEKIDFMAIREALAWSLPPVWNLASTAGETPIVSKRRLAFTEAAPAPWRYALEGLSYLVSATPGADPRRGPGVRVGPVTIYHNTSALPRVRLMGRPLVASGAEEAGRLLKEHGPELPERLVIESREPVEDVPDRVEGSARIVIDHPEHVAIAVVAQSPAFLVLSDTFDPGWRAWVDGARAELRPAYLAFRSVYVPAGRHAVVFRYEPRAFRLGLGLTGVGLAGLLLVLAVPRRRAEPAPLSGKLTWSGRWPLWLLLVMVAIVALSVPTIDGSGRLGVQKRWERSFHRFTWGSGIEAMDQVSPGPRYGT